MTQCTCEIYPFPGGRTRPHRGHHSTCSLFDAGHLAPEYDPRSRGVRPINGTLIGWRRQGRIFHIAFDRKPWFKFKAPTSAIAEEVGVALDEMAPEPGEMAGDFLKRVMDTVQWRHMGGEPAFRPGDAVVVASTGQTGVVDAVAASSEGWRYLVDLNPDQGDLPATFATEDGILQSDLAPAPAPDG